MKFARGGRDAHWLKAKDLQRVTLGYRCVPPDTLRYHGIPSGIPLDLGYTEGYPRGSPRGTLGYLVNSVWGGAFFNLRFLPPN